MVPLPSVYDKNKVKIVSEMAVKLAKETLKSTGENSTKSTENLTFAIMLERG